MSLKEKAISAFLEKSVSPKKIFKMSTKKDKSE